jgi:hypothetical protein
LLCCRLLKPLLVYHLLLMGYSLQL